MLFVLGGEVLRGFAFALLVGIIHRYLLVDLRGEPDRRCSLEREARARPPLALDVADLSLKGDGGFGKRRHSATFDGASVLRLAFSSPGFRPCAAIASGAPA